MSASNAIRFLQNNAGTDERSLALKMYWGSVVEAFRAESLLFDSTIPAIERKTVTSGKSWQFLMMADTPDPEDHTPGDELLGQPYAIDEGTITADDFLVAHQDVPLDQMHFAHFDILAKLGMKNGKRLARKFDRRLFQTAVLAARTAALTHAATGLTVHNGGNVVNRTGSATITTAYAATPAGASLLRADLAELAYNMDIDFVPPGDRYIVLHSHLRRVLTKDAGHVFGTTANYTNASPLTSNITNSNANMRQFAEIEGFKILGFANFQSENGSLPDTSVVETGNQSKYTVDCSGAATSTTNKPVAYAFAGGGEGMAGIGMVTFQGIVPHMEEDARRNTMFTKAQMLCGAGVLHPWCVGTVGISAS